MSSDIQPGDLVVCVDASPHRAAGGPCPLKLGGVYRVTDVWTYPNQSEAHVLVQGLRAIQLPQYKSPSGWGSRRFRKLNDGEDDAELITRIKSCQPVKQDA